MRRIYRPPIPVASPIPSDEADRMNTDMLRCIVARKREGKKQYSFHIEGKKHA